MNTIKTEPETYRYLFANAAVNRAKNLEGARLFPANSKVKKEASRRGDLKESLVVLEDRRKKDGTLLISFAGVEYSDQAKKYYLLGRYPSDVRTEQILYNAYYLCDR